MTRALLLYMMLASAPALAQIGPLQGHAEAKAGARASLAPDGPWLPTALAKEDTLAIHDQRAARPQFAEPADGALLALYADPAGDARLVAPAVPRQRQGGTGLHFGDVHL